MAFIKDIFKITKGKKEEETEVESSFSHRYIQIEDLRHNENLKYCIPNKKSVHVKKSDLIIAWDGANAGTVGVGLEGVIGSTLARLELKNNIVDPYYVARFLQFKFQYLRDNCTGTTIPHINKIVLENLSIPLPPLETQKSIVEVLAKAQGLIDARKEQIRLMDELVQSVFYEMFGDPVTNPRGWEVKELQFLCDVYRGGSPRPIKDFIGGTVPWIKIGDATGRDAVYLDSTKEYIIEEGIKKSRLVKKGSLIFANCGVSLGFARIISFDGCIHDGWLSFENIDKSINKIFLLKLLNCFTDYFRESAPDGTQPNLNTTIMKKFGVIVPPIEIQQAFEERLQSMIHQKDIYLDSLGKMEGMYYSIIQSTFT